MHTINKRKARKVGRWIYVVLAFLITLTTIPVFPSEAAAATVTPLKEIIGGPGCGNNLGTAPGEGWGSGRGATDVTRQTTSTGYKCTEKEPYERYVDLGGTYDLKDYRILVMFTGESFLKVATSPTTSYYAQHSGYTTWTSLGNFSSADQTQYQGKWWDITDTIGDKRVAAVEGYGVDFFANSSRLTTFGVRVVPKTAYLPSPPQVNVGAQGQSSAGWTKGPVNVWLDGDVAPEGLDYYEYSVNGSAFQRYTGPFAVSEHGVNSIYARTVDIKKNASGLSIGTVKIDRMPPTPPTITAAGNSNDYTLSLQAGADDYSGLAHTQFRIAGVVNQDWQDYGGPFHINKDGKSTVYARSIDSVGNVSQEVSKEVIIDKKGPTAPVIRVTEAGPTVNNVNVTIDSGSDPVNGIRMTQYRLNPEGAWQTYNGAFTLTAEGEYEIAARTINNLDVASPLTTQKVIIDRTKPTIPHIELSELTSLASYTNKPVTFEISGSTDAAPVHYEYQINGGSYNPGSSGTLDTSGMVKLIAVAVDAAGNRSAPATTQSFIDMVPPEINVTPNSRDWKEDAVDVEIRYKDEHSGIDPALMQYKVTNSPESPSAWDTAPDTQTRLTITSEGEWYIHAKVQDRAGNKFETTSKALRIQKAPQPAELSASAIRNKEVDLQWTLPSGYTDGYTYTIRNLTTNQIWDVPHPGNTFTDTGLQGGHRYEYELRSSNHVGGNAYSNRVSVLTLPDAPEDIRLHTVSRTPARIKADITPVASADRYHLTATDVNTGQVVFDSSSVTKDVYNSITNLAPGTVYDISAAAINATGEGAAKHISFLTLPDSPSGFRDVTVREDGIDLKWNTVTTATYYELERDSASVYKDVYSEFSDTGLRPGTEYDYAISAENTSGFGDYTHLGVTTLPGQVTTLSSVESDVYSTTVGWEDVQGADGYILNVNGDPDVRLTRGLNRYTFEGLPAGTPATIRIRAYNRSGTGKDTVITASTTPTAVVHPRAEDIQEHSAVIVWEPVQGSTKYKVSMNGQDYYSTANRVLVTGLEGGTSYSFQVSSGNNGGYGPASSGELLTLPPQVEGVKATELGNGQIQLNWSAAKSAHKYVIVRKDTDELMDASQPSIILPNFKPGIIYSFRIQAVNTTGAGDMTPYVYRTLPSVISNHDLVIKDISDTGMRVTWKEAEGADSYNIYQDGLLIGNTADLEFKVTGLDSSTIYKISVKPVNTTGEGKPTVGSAETLPSPEFDFTKTETTNSEVMIRWESIHRNDIFVLSDQNGKELYRGTDRAYIWSNLKEDKTYSVLLWAENSGGKRTEAKKATAKTTGSSAPAGGGGGGITPVVIKEQTDVKPPIEAQPSPTKNDSGNRFEDIDRIFNKDKINELADKGIIKGTSNKLFEPSRPVTRVEFTSMLVRALNLPSEPDMLLSFEDINPTAWYIDPLKTAIKDQVARGFSSTVFAPDRVINREQAAKMTNNVVKSAPQQEVNVYSDTSSIVAWARDDVLGLTEHNLVQGYPDGSFRPKQDITRAEAAEIIFNMLEKNK
ncbi:fibronectin type III domain-containing protein [Paenibacillus farraposensis]|uniref:Fibronectin type III domain-containing protein n=1 Tax=Paenibacillus farraposensis TaxID=2807095 RepID=A0ABW4DHE3_9BACL|nr:fibronectin type III domain-containing protein [Paenibacillus farraposensis]MCC3379198.1 fibronectin type III domain-containing protein [Paenibacillus farraposensis]